MRHSTARIVHWTGRCGCGHHAPQVQWLTDEKPVLKIIQGVSKKRPFVFGRPQRVPEVVFRQK